MYSGTADTLAYATLGHHPFSCSEYFEKKMSLRSAYAARFFLCNLLTTCNSPYHEKGSGLGFTQRLRCAGSMQDQKLTACHGFALRIPYRAHCPLLAQISKYIFEIFDENRG